jgi:hypothetical protein
MSKRVAVMFAVGDEMAITQMRGNKTVILMQTGDDVDLTAVNMEDFDDVCDVLEEALVEAKKKRHLQAANWNGSTGRC